MTILHSKGLTDEDVSTNLEMGFHLNNHQAVKSRFRPDLSDSKIYALKKNYATFLSTFQQNCLEGGKKNKSVMDYYSNFVQASKFYLIS